MTLRRYQGALIQIFAIFSLLTVQVLLIDFEVSALYIYTTKKQSIPHLKLNISHFVQ